MISDKLIHIRLIRPDDVETLKAVANQDGHIVIAPTFVVEKGQQMVGYIGVVPCVLVWLDSERVGVRDSVMALNFFENHLAVQGTSIIALPCLEKSPLRPFIPAVGYMDCGDSKLFMKNLNQG